MMSQLQVGNKLFQILDNVPEEYTALSDAISRIFYVCGSQKLCGACFQGKLQNYASRRDSRLYRSYGCCGGCTNLSSTGCVQKPLGCASWLCPYTANLLPERVGTFLAGDSGQYAAPSARRGRTRRSDSFHSWMYKRTGKTLFEYFRISGFNIQLSMEDRRAFDIMTRRINRIADWLERTGLNKPNWPLMEKITRAEKGVLYEPSVQ